MVEEVNSMSDRCRCCGESLQGDEWRCPECGRDLVGDDGAEDRRRGPL